MDIVFLKTESLSIFLPGLVRKVKSIDTILDFDAGNYSSAATIVEAIRTEVADYCVQRKFASSKDEIRANVFIPTMGHDCRGHTFVLKMHPRLMKNMQRDQEHGITFCLGQGASGHVYETGTPKFTTVRDHRIPPHLAELVHPDLKWWATFPLKNKESSMLGVVNVDGLGFDVPAEEHVNINNIIAKYVDRLGGELDSEPKKEIFIIQKPSRKKST